jgi:RNA polymerase sigma-70 factor (ECF subfamily)
MTEDESSFEDFYRATASRLIGQVALLTGDREEARDCVHEAMERAWLRWGHVRTLQDPESWVRTVAWRTGISRWRRVRTGARLMARQRPRESYDDHAGGVADSHTLAAALRQLPPDQRLALVLYHVCDLDVVTVAEQTGSSVSAVKSRLSRGRRALAEALGDPALDAGDEGVATSARTTPARTTLQAAFGDRTDDMRPTVGFAPTAVPTTASGPWQPADPRPGLLRNEVTR